MKSPAYYFVNAITGYRLLSAFLLFYLVYADRLDVFRWLIAVSFATDMADGYLARKFSVTSVFGARMDSIGDDLTILAGLTGIWFFRKDFIAVHKFSLALLLGLFVVQTLIAVWRYRRISSSHTLMAKLAALLQGSFMILLFFMEQPMLPLYYAAVVVTAVELVEEIIITLLLPQWKTDVKGLYWVLKDRKAGIT